MKKEKLKNYPNVRVSPETFEILGYLKEERGSSYDVVIKDMSSEFAPFLVHMISLKNNPNKSNTEEETIKTNRYNLLLGAKVAYTDYWLRMKRKQKKEIFPSIIDAEERSLTIKRKSNRVSMKRKNTLLS